MERDTAAAILVQTIFASSEPLKLQLTGQAAQSPVAAADFLVPYYAEVLSKLNKAHQTDPRIR